MLFELCMVRALRSLGAQTAKAFSAHVPAVGGRIVFLMIFLFLNYFFGVVNWPKRQLYYLYYNEIIVPNNNQAALSAPRSTKIAGSQ